VGGLIIYIIYVINWLSLVGWLVGGYEIDDLFFFLFVSIT